MLSIKTLNIITIYIEKIRLRLKHKKWIYNIRVKYYNEYKKIKNSFNLSSHEAKKKINTIWINSIDLPVLPEFTNINYVIDSN